MIVLGVETSCDETGLALLRHGRVAAEVLSSQEDLHALFGGVVPEVASREHLRHAGPLFEALLDRAGLAATDIDVIAVARGPGLLGSLLVGLALAKGLALATGARLIGVDHLRAHLLAAGLSAPIAYPALGLLVSGGHTQLVLMRSPLDFTTLGRTLDDAAGEAFDKAAKSLNLPYPGGRHLDLLGRGLPADPGLFPRPYLDNDNLDFSFSGLKTAVAAYVQGHPELRVPVMPARDALDDPEAWPEGLRRVCAAIGQAIASTLAVKTRRAIEAHGPLAGLVAAGGVAANSRVRAELAGLAEAHGLALSLPPPALCADNGVMIAHAGEILARAGLRHGLDLDAVPRGRDVPWDYLAEGSDMPIAVDTSLPEH